MASLDSLHRVVSICWPQPYDAIASILALLPIFAIAYISSFEAAVATSSGHQLRDH